MEPMKQNRLKHFILDVLHNEEGWSDLHLKEGDYPRVRGSDMTVAPRADWTITSKDIYELLDPDPQSPFREEWEKTLEEGGGNTDFALVFDNTRFRVNLFHYKGRRLGLVMRKINNSIPALETLGLPPSLADLVDEVRSGMILVTGETGSGKSTTLAAMIQRLNETHAMHIVTLEDPAEYQFENALSTITQREIGPGKDADNFATALRAALRQDPDIIMVGEMRDRETATIALEAAQTGHLVLATMHTRSAAETIERFIAVFEAEVQGRARADLASVLRAVISQSLMPSKGGGRALGYEVLINTRGIPPIIRDGKTQQIPNEMLQGKKYGMNLLNERLHDLVIDGKIERIQAYKHAYDHEGLHKMLAGGV